MSYSWIRRFLVLFVVSLALAASAGVSLLAADMYVSSSRGPTGYRGLVAANFDPSDANDEFVADFGSLGVWVHKVGVWTKITNDNPEWIFAVKWGGTGDFELVGDFGAKGLWRWDYPSTWTQLSASNADGGIAVDDDVDGRDELQVAFGGIGLWRYDLDAQVWTQLTTSNPAGTGLRVDLDAVGHQEGMWSFPGKGLWIVYQSILYPGGPIWVQLSASMPSEDWAAANFVDDTGVDPDDELVVEFSGLGTWLFDSGHGWGKITDSLAHAIVPTKFGQSADWEVAFADTSSAPWAWYGGSLWLRLSYSPLESGFVVAFDPDVNASGETAGELELAADFGALGLWRYNYGTNGSWVDNWMQISTQNPVFMVPSDYYHDGSQTALVTSFGAGVGLWLWDSGGGIYTPTWIKLTDSAPDANLGW